MWDLSDRFQREVVDDFLDEYRAGRLSPVFFGSAIKDIGVLDLLDALAEFGPRPRAQPADTRTVEAAEPALTALVLQSEAKPKRRPKHERHHR